ncbi:MAG: TetR/AcrR family transcriptional regulator [Litoreibacter sp.]|nr:TetR/AcrR family transcriptional regulator [Litoreibacter sp.]MCY4334020.1 TetR/AcrR family transcriptional regulator [Litoreibacter sp.]
MDKRSSKENQILDCALKLLVETGDSGLTLRKIADCAGMRLSNVQYYFKSRDDVLVAMVSRYFDECTSSLLRLTEASDAQTQRDRIRFLVRSGLAHGVEISDMCRAFREIWAISSRSDVIDRALMNYYDGFADVMATYALGNDADQHSREKLKALLVPYFEGYSVTARSLTLDLEATEQMLTKLVRSVVRANGPTA